MMTVTFIVTKVLLHSRTHHHHSSITNTPTITNLQNKLTERQKVSRTAGYTDPKALSIGMTVGIKVFLYLCVLVFTQRNLLLEGSNSNRGERGWIWSLWILTALLRALFWNSCSRVTCFLPTILLHTFTMPDKEFLLLTLSVLYQQINGKVTRLTQQMHGNTVLVFYLTPSKNSVDT